MNQHVKQAKDSFNNNRSSAQPGVAYSDISGAWFDLRTGASYQIAQQGNYFTLQEISFGVISAQGQGTISERRGNFSYTTFLGSYGVGTLQVSADGQTLTSTLNPNGSSTSEGSVRPYCLTPFRGLHLFSFFDPGLRYAYPGLGCLTALRSMHDARIVNNPTITQKTIRSKVFVCQDF